MNLKIKIIESNKITLSGIRCYPESDIPFGINFCKNDGEPSSAIILGSNGIGKSSVFDALEYMFCGRIGEYEMRNDEVSYSDDYSIKFETYLTHLNANNSSANCSIDTISSNTSFPDKMFPAAIRKQLIPNSFFISEYDIYTIGKLDFEISDEKSFHYFIANSLGLKSYLDFLKTLNLFENYNRTKESRTLNTSQKEVDALIKNIKKWDDEIDRKKEIATELTSSTPNNNRFQEEIKKNIELVNNLLNTKYNIQTDDYLKFVTNSFLNSYRELRQIAISKNDENSVEFFGIGLDLLVNSEDCPFCNDSQKTKEEIEIHVKNKISTVQSFSKKRRELSENFYALTDCINQYFDGIIVLKHNIEYDNNSDLIKISEILPLVNLNEGFIQELNSFLEHWSFIQKENIQFTLTEADRLFDELVEFNTFFNIILPNSFIGLTNYANKRNNILNEAIELLTKKTSIQQNDHYKQIGILEREIHQFTIEKNEALKRLKDAEIEKSDAEMNSEIYKNIKREASIYRSIVKREIDKKISNVFEPIKDIVETLLNEFNFNDEFEITVGKGYVVDKETSDIISEYIKIFALKNGVEYDIKRYLNTFRYKLFSLIISLSVAIASRKQNSLNINIPFVIDDIFYSSDFEKRLLVEDFIGKFYDLYSKHCPGSPMQLILFTHDELIFDCILSRLIKMDLTQKTIFGRLISYNDTLEIKNHKELLYRIPDSIPKIISSNINELLTS